MRYPVGLLESWTSGFTQATPMIDLHCHVLPGLDDGPQTLSESVAMCRAAAAEGIREIVATPHVSPQWSQNTAAAIGDAVEELTEALLREGIELTISAGAEVALTLAGQMSDEQLQSYHLGGGPWLLVECPHSPSTAGFERVLSSIQERNHRIVLAHPERSLAFHRDPGTLVALVRAGMLCSITAGSLTGRFGRTVQQHAQRLLREGLVHNIASDGHNLTRRPPLSTADLQAAGMTQTAADWYVERVPRAILEGSEIPSRDMRPIEEPVREAPVPQPQRVGERLEARYGREIAEAEEELAKLRREVARLRGESGQARDEREQADRDRDRAREEYDRAAAWLASVAAELEHLERSLAVWRAELEPRVEQTEPPRSASQGRYR